MSFTFSSLGTFQSKLHKKYHLPHQSTGIESHTGIIEIEAGTLSAQSIEDLKGFDRIWLVFVFHQSQKNSITLDTAKVQPPRHATTKKSVFATRSPHRFNSIGLTAAKLDAISGNKLYVSEVDLLDGTPILDIKPYIPEYDSFPDAKIGWMDTEPLDQWSINWATTCEQGLKDTIEGQLRYRPFDTHRHRIDWNDETKQGTLAIAENRIEFSFNPETKTFNIQKVNYAKE